jgi:hypothetical protein
VATREGAKHKALKIPRPGAHVKNKERRLRNMTKSCFPIHN